MSPQPKRTSRKRIVLSSIEPARPTECDSMVQCERRERLADRLKNVQGRMRRVNRRSTADACAASQILRKQRDSLASASALGMLPLIRTSPRFRVMSGWATTHPYLYRRRLTLIVTMAFGCIEDRTVGWGFEQARIRLGTFNIRQFKHCLSSARIILH